MANEDDPIKIQDLYPELSPEEQEQAAENWRQYLRVVRRIFDGLEREGKLYKVHAEARRLRRKRAKRK